MGQACDFAILNQQPIGRKKYRGKYRVNQFRRAHPGGEESQNRKPDPGRSFLIASDAMPWMSTTTGQAIDPNAWPLPDDAFSHPRSAGTFTRFLSQYVRERKLINWSDAIAKTSYLPAKLLEFMAPKMKNKGRVQVGMDADVVVLDPATLQDRATYERPNQTSVGVKYLVVNGAFVIRNSDLDTKAFPGQPVRRPVSQ